MDLPMSQSLDYIKHIIMTSPILAYYDPDKQYYLFTESSKHLLSVILVQYTEQEQENGTKLNLSHPITYQSETFQGSQKSWSALTKEAYAVYMSFQKMVFYFKTAYVMIWCDDAPLSRFIYSVMKMTRSIIGHRKYTL